MLCHLDVFLEEINLTALRLVLLVVSLQLVFNFFDEIEVQLRLLLLHLLNLQLLLVDLLRLQSQLRCYVKVAVDVGADRDEHLVRELDFRRHARVDLGLRSFAEGVLIGGVSVFFGAAASFGLESARLGGALLLRLGHLDVGHVEVVGLFLGNARPPEELQVLLAEYELVHLVRSVLLVVIELVPLVERHRLKRLILLGHELQFGTRISAVLTGVHFQLVLIFEVLANDMVALLYDEFYWEAPLLRTFVPVDASENFFQVRVVVRLGRQRFLSSALAACSRLVIALSGHGCQTCPGPPRRLHDARYFNNALGFSIIQVLLRARIVTVLQRDIVV